MALDGAAAFPQVSSALDHPVSLDRAGSSETGIAMIYVSAYPLQLGLAIVDTSVVGHYHSVMIETHRLFGAR